MMLHTRLIISSITAASIIASSTSSALAAAPANTLGRILLQVESRGEAWYVDPLKGERFYLRDGNEAYSALRTYGLGIKNQDLEKIPIGLESRFQETDTDNDSLSDKLELGIGTNPNKADSDGDGYNDGNEVTAGYSPKGSGKLPLDTRFANGLKGRILLQVEARGEAWYVNPVDGKRYYMSGGEAAYAIMRYLSLGISNANLAKIPVARTAATVMTSCGDNLDCFISAVRAGKPVTATPTFRAHVVAFDVYTTSKATITHTINSSSTSQYLFDQRFVSSTFRYGDTMRQQLRASGKTDAEINAMEADMNRQPSAIFGDHILCRHSNQEGLIAYLETAKTQQEVTDLSIDTSATTYDIGFAMCDIVQ